MREFLEITFDKFIFKVKKGLLYSKEHFWVEPNTDSAAVGVTDFLQQTSGDAAFIELPPPGAKITAGGKFGVMETIKSVVDLTAPASGEVLELNSTLTGEPELINEEPYGAGWLIKVSLKNVGVPYMVPNLSELMKDEEYLEYMKKEIEKRV